MRMLRRTLRAGTLLWGVLLLAGCGDSTGPEAPSLSVDAVVIEQTPADSLRVERVAPDSMRARVSDAAGNAVPGVLVNFQTTPDGCARADAAALQTNANGRVFFEVSAGTQAWTSTGEACTVRAVQSEQGRAAVADSFGLWVEPGAPAEGPTRGMTMRSTGSLVLPATMIRDAHGNPSLWRAEVDSVAHVQATAYGTEDGRTLVADSAGTAIGCLAVADSAVAAVKVETDESGSISATTTSYGAGFSVEDCR